jgi:hypothetical protein
MYFIKCCAVLRNRLDANEPAKPPYVACGCHATLAMTWWLKFLFYP